MYSKEDREWALYVLDECNGSVRKAARLAGGPSTETIRLWSMNRDALPKLKRKKPVELPYVTKLALVRRYLGGESRQDLAAEAGISPCTLSSWKRAYLERGAVALMPSDQTKPGLPVNLPEPPDDIEELKRRNKELELRNAILEQTIIILKKGPGVGPELLANREKALIVDALRNGFDLNSLLGAMGLARSTYYYALAAMAAGDKYAELRIRVRDIFDAHACAWGSERIWGALRIGDDGKEPVIVSEKVVRRLMREEGLKVIFVKKKRSYSSYGGEISEHPGNRVNRNFHADAPNKLWLTDITQFTLPNFKCYLSPIIDCFDGRVVSFRISQSPNAELANSMLDDAAAKLAPGESPMCHNDCGVHYRWPGWIERCERYGIERSMSKKGCSPDNSACEGFFGRLKNEFFYYRDWSGVTFEEFANQLSAWIDYHNERRIKKSLGWMSPNQYRRS